MLCLILLTILVSVCSCSSNSQTTQQKQYSKTTASNGDAGLKIGLASTCIIVLLFILGLCFMCCEGKCCGKKKKPRTSMRVTPSATSRNSRTSRTAVQGREEAASPSPFGSVDTLSFSPPPYDLVPPEGNPPAYDTIHNPYGTSALAHPVDFAIPVTPPPQYEDLDRNRDSV